MVRLASLVALLVVAAAAISPAFADEADPPIGWSLGAGAAVAILPLAVGGALTTLDSRATRNAGLYVITAGLALAPIVSHLVLREWKRAAIFGAVPAASLLAMVAMLHAAPDVLTEEGGPSTRIPFAAILIAAVFSSGVGIADCILAGDRKKKSRITVAPAIGIHQYGLMIGGLF